MHAACISYCEDAVCVCVCVCVLLQSDQSKEIEGGGGVLERPQADIYSQTAQRLVVCTVLAIRCALSAAFRRACSCRLQCQGGCGREAGAYVTSCLLPPEHTHTPWAVPGKGKEFSRLELGEDLVHAMLHHRLPGLSALEKLCFLLLPQLLRFAHAINHQSYDCNVHG